MNGVSTMKPFPYQLRLHFKGNFNCGAVLLSPNIALTAFHCIAYFNRFHVVTGMKAIKDFEVYAGVYESKVDNNMDVQKRGVIKAFEINTKNDSRYNLVPDLAVLILDEPLEMNEYVTPACLPTREAPMGEECIVSGWGAMDAKFEGIFPSPTGYVYPETLQAATVSITKLENCINNPAGDYDLCAYHPTKGPCNGDSGGPLVCKTNGGATLYGVVSRVKYDCYTSSSNVKYGVYGNVYHFKDEIEKFIRKFEDPCPTNEYGYGDGMCDGHLNDAEHCFEGGELDQRQVLCTYPTLQII